MVPMKTRADFPEILNQYGLHGKYVEVGVERGAFSRIFVPMLQNKLIEHLYLIDPWRADMFCCPIAQAAMDAMQYEVEEIFKDLPVTIMKTTSVEGAAQFAFNSLDFVYLDAKHDFDSILQDFDTWYPRVKKGGIIGGHDYSIEGVKQVVDFKATGLKAGVVLASEEPAVSWYMHKG